MPFTVCLVGDPHYKTGNGQETDEMERQLDRLLDKRPADLIVIMGDVLDRHETVHLSPYTRACAWIDALRRRAPVRVLVGNHDRKNNRDFLGPEHSLVGLKNWDQVRVVDQPFVETLGGYTLAFVPYVPPGRFREALDLAPGWQQAALVFAHQEFLGAQMGSVVSAEGDEWPADAPAVFSGHIHDYQELGNVTYVGTPIQHSFGDSHKKTVSLLELDGEDMVHSRIDLGCTRKRIVTVDEAELPTYVLPPRCRCNVKVRGGTTALRHPNVAKWKAAGHSVTIVPPPAARPSGPSFCATQTFRQLLDQKIQAGDAQLRLAYAALFS